MPELEPRSKMKSGGSKNDEKQVGAERQGNEGLTQRSLINVSIARVEQHKSRLSQACKCLTHSYDRDEEREAC
jgi:hypothetical protein